MSYEASSFLKNFIPSINKLPIVAGITKLINQIVVVTNPIANVLTVKIAKISWVTYIFLPPSKSSMVGSDRHNKKHDRYCPKALPPIYFNSKKAKQ
jgi:hypothetical protein